ncbi:MAG: type III pantothenate kinase [Candidatus Dadabacteria bacterium]|nr:type III pantothenate kinase [Candidatus Dadabacteria bacterium]
MILALDIGNTNIAFGLCRDGEILSQWRIGTDKTRTSDEYGILLRSLIETRDIGADTVTGAIISCVVPPLLGPLTDTVRDHFNVSPIIVGPGVKTGMPILYSNPKEVGADRIVNGVAAYNKYKKAVVVVDFGTATTFDCISQSGEYIGGVIAPGLQISSEALFNAASKLPKVEIVRPRTVVGKTTVESMQSGLVYGYAGLVDGIVERIRREMDVKVRVVATGGLSALIAKESKTIEEVDDLLTLKGLMLIYEWNRP